MSTPPTNNGAKAFGGVVLVLAVISGIYATVRPSQQRIDFLSTQLERLQEDLRLHEGIPIHTGAAADVASIREKFVEVETQFDDLERRMLTFEEWREWWFRTLPTVEATQAEKIAELERKLLRGKGE